MVNRSGQPNGKIKPFRDRSSISTLGEGLARNAYNAYVVRGVGEVEGERQNANVNYMSSYPHKNGPQICFLNVKSVLSLV